jgi:hypothetical protein
MRIPQIRSQDIPLTAPPPTCHFCQSPEHVWLRGQSVNELLCPFSGKLSCQFCQYRIRGSVFKLCCDIQVVVKVSGGRVRCVGV